MTHFNQSVRIGNRLVGPGLAPFIVAEAGINHNGDLHTALEMVRVAKSAGCDAIKFQTFKAEEFISDPTQMFTYQSQGVQITESMLEMFKRYELAEHAWKLIKEECDRQDIIFFSTPQNQSDLELLLEIGVPAVKVGSDDFTNIPLLRSYSKTGLPLILSSGMSDLSEAYQAVEAVGGLDGYPLILLVCTSQYPTPPGDCHLTRLGTLRAAFPGIPIGFSDHTCGPLASSLSVALGAVFIEKHFTLSHDLPGPDHWFSENIDGLHEWVRSVRSSYQMLGSPIVRPTKEERSSKKEYQRRIVAAKEIKPGAIFSESNLCLRRVSGGRGLPPNMMSLILNMKSPKQYSLGDPIDLNN